MAASNLYRKLFRSRSAQRDRLEDFLTEALADLLNRLSEEQRVNFCTECFLLQLSESERNEWKNFAAASSRTELRTQEPITALGAEKRPDLVLYGQKGDETKNARKGRSGPRAKSLEPLMLIEAKISAPFGVSQLLSYDGWLSECGAPCAALVTLTHTTNPPPDFTIGSATYRTKLRSSVRWSSVHTRIRAMLDDSTDRLNPTVASLAHELIDFMEEEGIAFPEPTLQDVAAARIYLASGAHERLAAFMKGVRVEVQQGLPEAKKKKWLGSSPSVFSQLETEAGALEDWFELHKGVYVHWGIYVGAGYWPEYMEPKIPRSDGGTVWIDFGERKVARPGAGKFSDWHFPAAEETEYFVVCKVLDLDTISASKSVGQFATWVIGCIQEAKQIIDACTT